MDHKEQEKQSKQSELVTQTATPEDGTARVMAKAAPEETGRKTPGRWKTWFRKRWVPPVVYLAVAAIIFTIMWQLQDRNDYSLTPEELGISVQEDADLAQDEAQTVPVTGQEETMIEPHRGDDAVIVRHYFDEAAGEDNAKAMVRYGDSYTAHTGIDYALENGEPFEVVAALSGTVRRVEQDPLVGHLVELSHDDGLETVYQSLAEVYVKEGDTVTQGTVLGIAGRNEYEQDSGNHLHFEVRKNGETVSPLDYLNAVASENGQPAADSKPSVGEDVHGGSGGQTNDSAADDDTSDETGQEQTEQQNR